MIRAKAAPALREFVRATGIPVAETFMGKGLLSAEDDKALGSVGLQAGDYEMAGFERRRRGAGDRLRPRRALARALEPEARQADHLHRLRAGRDRRELHPRGGAGRRHLQRAHPPRRGVPPRAPPGRLDQAARRGAGPLRAGEGRRLLPGSAAARALGDPPGARPRGHPDLGRRPAQALDRAHVPGLRAEHGADRQRAGRDGLRGAGGRGGQARSPRAQGRDRERRRRLPHELPGARDRGADRRRRS